MIIYEAKVGFTLVTGLYSMSNILKSIFSLAEDKFPHDEWLKILP